MTQASEPPPRGPDYAAPASPGDEPPETGPARWQSQYGPAVGSVKVARAARVKGIALVASLVLLVPIAVFILVNIGRWEREADVGRCVQLSGTIDEVQTTFVDCQGEDFTWLVAAVGTSTADCPSSDYYATFYEIEQRDQTIQETGAVCLMPNFDAGECYFEHDSTADPSQVNLFEVRACSDPEAHFRVAAVHDAQDPRRCEIDEVPVAFPEPARTYCLEFRDE